MSTGSGSPVVPAVAEWNKVSAYIKAHERLIILVLSLGVGMHFYSKVIGAWAQYRQGQDNAAHAVLLAQDDKDKAIATANLQAAAQYQQLALQLAASNKALATAQTTRDTATKTQQAVDQTLTIPELADRWGKLLNLYPGSVVPTPGTSGALAVTPYGARETVTQLELVPTLQADLKGAQATVANGQAQLSSLTDINTGLHTQIDGLTTKSDLADKACVADKNLLKAQARKSKLKWFVGGYVAGLATRGAIKIFAGI